MALTAEQRAEAGLFISYRREDSSEAATVLCGTLREQFATSQVFIDVDRVVAGDRIDAVISREIARSGAMVVLIGPSWLDADATGRRRLDARDDWVRFEIEEAQRYNVAILPVLVEGGAMPRSSDLPSTCDVIAKTAALEFGRDLVSDHIVEAVRRALSSAQERHTQVVSDVIAEVEEAFEAGSLDEIDDGIGELETLGHRHEAQQLRDRRRAMSQAGSPADRSEQSSPTRIVRRSRSRIRPRLPPAFLSMHDELSLRLRYALPGGSVPQGLLLPPARAFKDQCDALADLWDDFGRRGWRPEWVAAPASIDLQTWSRLLLRRAGAVRWKGDRIENQRQPIEPGWEVAIMASTERAPIQIAKLSRPSPEIVQLLRDLPWISARATWEEALDDVSPTMATYLMASWLAHGLDIDRSTVLKERVTVGILSSSARLMGKWDNGERTESTLGPAESFQSDTTRNVGPGVTVWARKPNLLFGSPRVGIRPTASAWDLPELRSREP